MKVNPRIRRMDSMIIEANIKNLSRAELLYSCAAKLVRQLHKMERDDLLKDMEHYYEPNDSNRTFYYNDSTSTEDVIKSILPSCEKIPCRPYASPWDKAERVFLWVQSSSLKCSEIAQLPEKEGTIYSKSTFCRIKGKITGLKPKKDTSYNYSDGINRYTATKLAYKKLQELYTISYKLALD